MKKLLLILFCAISLSASTLLDEPNFEEVYKTELSYIEKIKPIALKINQEVLKERKLIEAVNLKNLSQQDKDFLDEKAAKYDIFTRLKDQVRYEYIYEHLLYKVDILAPSLLIAISGIETDWGRSRIVKEANSLYKELAWDNSGLKPQGETTDDSYTIKKFATIEDSMRSYLLKINSSLDFYHLRHARSLFRIKGTPMQGRSVAHNFHLQTPLKNYTGLLDYTITFYRLDTLDRANNYSR